MCPKPNDGVHASATLDAERRGVTAYLMCVCPHRNSKCSGESKVSKLEIVVLVDEKVLWLEISVKYAVRMAVQEPRRQLVSKFLEYEIVSIDEIRFKKLASCKTEE